MEINKRVVKQTMGDGDGNTQIAEQNIYYTYQKKEAVVQECHERYQNDWNAKMFLTRNITLKKLYRLPYYEEYKKENCSLYQRLKNVLKNSNDFSQRMLLILGQPGSGKTTLMSYVLNHYSDELTGKKVRMYSFKSFTGIDWSNSPENLFREMLIDMGLAREDLNNSVLILDGLDEVRMSNKQEQFLNFIYSDWIESNTIKNFSMLVTCRINRISNTDDLDCPYIHLRPFSKKQIVNFVKKYDKYDSSSITKIKNIIQILEKNYAMKEVLGIPLILYMILALGIEIDEESHLVEVYNKIFSVRGKNSIYRRGNYDHKQVHAITETVLEEIHQFSKDIALQMWKDKEQQAVVKKEDYERIAKKVTSNVDVRELLIGQYFVEGQDSCELYFLHRSMYQYFVALSIFDSVKNMINQGNPIEQFNELVKNCHSYKNSCMTTFAGIAGMNVIYADPDIEQYLLYMLKNLSIEDNQWWKTFFGCFLDKGFTHYVDNHEAKSLTRIHNELNRYYNLIWLTREQLKSIDKSCLFYKVAEPDENFCFYLRQRTNVKDDLEKIDLEKADLSGADLSGADLKGVNLSGAYLVGADLSEADLSGADLSESYLEGANLSEADLSGADLSGAYLVGAYLRGASLSGTDLRGTIVREIDLRESSLKGIDLSEAHLLGKYLGRHVINNVGMKINMDKQKL